MASTDPGSSSVNTSLMKHFRNLFRSRYKQEFSTIHIPRALWTPWAIRYEQDALQWLLMVSVCQWCKRFSQQWLEMVQTAWTLPTPARSQAIIWQWISEVCHSAHVGTAAKDIKRESIRHRLEDLVFQAYTCCNWIKEDSFARCIDVYRK